MGKHALVVLCAAFALTALTTNGGGQDAPKPAEPPKTADIFKPGAFLTADDVEHLDAALGYVNLTRAQLNYEKKHADEGLKRRLRLGTCARALDAPLALPGVAEEAAKVYGFNLAQFPPDVKGHLLHKRFSHTLRLLDQDVDDDPKRAREIAADKLAEQDRKAIQDFMLQAVFGRDFQLKLAHRYSPSEADQAAGSRKFTQFDLDRLFDPALESLAVPALIFGREATVANEQDRDLLTRSPQHLLEASSLLSGECTMSELLDAGTRLNLAPPMLTGHWFSWALVEIASKLRGRAAAADKGYAGSPLHPDAVKLDGVTGGVLGLWESKLGKFVVGGTGPNTYEGDDFVGIIDLGGDDVYRGRVASGIGLPDRRVGGRNVSPLSFVLDLGGNDRYEGEDFTQGFGFLGVGILHDLGGGNDTYKARFCSQACGLCGYGELYDDGGDDFYQADSGVQGAGVFGYGHLIDARGNDVYRACRYAQAFAQVKGVGVLTDGAGNDLYYAGGKYLHQPLWNDRYQSLSQGFAIGNRNDGTGGGVALLLDEGDGNDVYQADIYGQGSSYWYSLGMLVDRGGNDTYTLGQYGQGGGIHLSAGILVDLAGNDTYTNPFGVGTGGAHDWAVGWLIDRAGNDLYQGNGQGQGLNYAIGILLDCAGNDSRSTNNEGSIGKGHNNDISLVLDLGGTDNYGSKEIKDGEITRRDPHALVYDVPEGWFPSIDPLTWPTPQSPAPDKAVVQHILIAWDGTGVDTQKQKRTKDEATALMRRVMKQSRSKGADWKQLQADYNEDCSKGVDDEGKPYDSTHNKYTVTPTARLVKPFLDLSLKLGVGQIDVCESKYGWHIIKRVE